MNFLQSIATAELKGTSYGDIGAQLAKLLLSRPWLADEVIQAEAAVIHALKNIAERDLNLARHIAALPWLTDDATVVEWSASSALDDISDKDLELARRVTAFPWFVDDVTTLEVEILRQLRTIVSRDLELANSVASFPWFSGGVTETEGTARYALLYIISSDFEFANDVMALSWLVDGVSEAEASALKGVSYLSYTNLDMAQQVAVLPWFADGVTEDEAWALIDLSELSNTDLGQAQQVAVLPWLVGGVTEDEGAVRRVLLEVASRDIDFANEMAVLPWLSDGVTKLESSAVYALASIVSRDIEFARTVISWPKFEGGVIRDLDFFLLYALDRMDSERLSDLRAQPWFVDGLDDEEAALVSTLFRKHDQLYKELIDVYHIQHNSISLPLAGFVDVWIIKDSHPVPHEDVLMQVEETARIAEELLVAPFPTPDIIVLVATEREKDYGQIVAHFGNHIGVTVYRGEPYGVPHETAHYYFHSRLLRHRWFTEGGANFIEALFHERRGHQELSDRESEVSEEVQTYCTDWGVENIRHNAYLLKHGQISFFQCTNRMGENLLLNLLKIMGKEAMSSTLNELYVSSGGHVPVLRFSTPPSEVEIYEAFLKHTPPERQEEVRELFRELHGGDFVFPEIDFSDVEGNEAADSVPIEVGESVEGSLDYIFDFDYFRFQAEQGQRYWISVEHETLGHSSITLYGPNGVSEERDRWKARGMGPDGPLILWVSPSAEGYYFAVQNFGGKTGDYALTITSVDIPETDDHGDTAESATRIRLERSVNGTINDALDYDYFSFNAEEGEKYSFDIY